MASPRTGGDLNELCANARRFESPQDYLKACAEKRVLKLTRDLVKFETVSADGPVHENPGFLQMADYLNTWASQHGATYEEHGKHDVWVLAEACRTLHIGIVRRAPDGAVQCGTVIRVLLELMARAQ